MENHPSGLKPRKLSAIFGTAEQLAEKSLSKAQNHPSGAKAPFIQALRHG